MAFDVQTLTDAARCAECLSPNQKQNVLLYLLNGILENGAGGGGSALHNLLSLTHPDTVPGPPLRGSLIAGNATPDWEALPIGAAGRFLGSDGTDPTWTALPGSFTGFANPTAQVGLVAVNGVATTAMRSDAAPALDQGIVPTWTGAHTWTPPANTTPITVSGYSITGANTQALLNLSGTWNTSGAADGILFNVVNTASSGGSRLISLSLDSLRRFEVYQSGFTWVVMNDAIVNAAPIALEVYHNSTVGTPVANNGVGIDFRMDSDTTDRQFGGRWTVDWAIATHATRTARFRFFMASSGVSTEIFQMTPTLVSVLNSATLSVAAQNAIQVSPFGAAAGNTSELRFLELAASGTNYTGFKAADAMAASEIYVLPDAAPSANRFLRAGAVAAGVSTLSWAQISLTADVTGILPVANGGTGTSTAFTQGSVIFAGAAGVFTEDNANFFWDDTNNRLGIGTMTPAAYLELSSNLFPSNNALVITLSNNTGTNFPNIFYRRSRGTVALPTAVMTDDRLGGFGFRGYGATGYFTADNAVFRVFAAENFTNTEQGTYFTFESTPIGSLTRLERMRIDTFSISMSPTGTAADRTNELRFLELAANGTNYTGFRASDAMAASEIYVLPNAAPAGNRFLQAAAVAGGVSALSWAQVSLTADVTGTLPVTNGGTGTGTAFTQGSVIFAGPAGVFAEDNANFFWDDSMNRLTVNQISMPTTTSDSVGGIYFGGNRVLHNFGINNLFVGAGSGNVTMTGSLNSFLGAGTGALNTSGTGGTFFGALAGQSNLAGNNNSFFGNGAGLSNTNGEFNSFFGANAGASNVTGIDNSFFGGSSGYSNTGSRNTFFGVSSGQNNIGGNNNVIFGFQAGNNLITGSNNIVIGYDIDSPTDTNSNTLTVGNLIFGTGLDGAATTLSSGNIGIGVITPLAKFHVTNSAAATVATIIKAAAAQSANLTEWQDSSAVILSKVNSAGNVGVRMAATALTAYLHIAAGTTAASTAPIKLTTGTSMTAAEAGSVEFTTDDLFFTITTGTARKRLLMADATAGLTSGKIPIVTTNGRLIDLTASATYTPTNVTTDRSWDCNATSIDEIADVLATVVQDLQAVGVLG